MSNETTELNQKKISLRNKFFFCKKKICPWLLKNYFKKIPRKGIDWSKVPNKKLTEVPFLE